jgi:hypothetical protein
MFNSYGNQGSSAGVYGIAADTDPGGDAFGVLGVCRTKGGLGPGPNFAAGVYGQADSSIKSGKTAGVIGETWIGEADGAGVVGFNNSQTGATRGVWGEVESADGAGVFGRNASSSAGTKGGSFQNAAGTWAYIAHWNGANHYGILSNGLTSTVTPTGSGSRALYAAGSPEVWLEDFGEGKLDNGHARVDLDALFLETVTISEKHPMKVFVQLNDDCEGVYVKRGNTGFDVHELNNGKSNAHFSYRVVAKRKGYEGKRLEVVEQELSNK